MLKRAKCSIYLAQESDTFGKDSELASTLAQGKSVVAYVPGFDEHHRDEDFKNWMLNSLEKLYPEFSKCELALRQLQIFDPAAAWKDSVVRNWLADHKRIAMPQLQKRLREAIRTHYDSRAKTLRDSHPLGIQVNLQTGVANGVLVARNAQQCADLVHGIVTNSLKFEIEVKEIKGLEYLLLREVSTKSIYRVVTGDELLTRTFWNFYLGGLRV